MLVLGVLNDANPTGDVAEAQALALLLAFLSGAIMVLLGLLRMGGVSNFVSHSVLTGFTAAAAAIIAMSQARRERYRRALQNTL